MQPESNSRSEKFTLKSGQTTTSRLKFNLDMAKDSTESIKNSLFKLKLKVSEEISKLNPQTRRVLEYMIALILLIFCIVQTQSSFFPGLPICDQDDLKSAFLSNQLGTHHRFLYLDIRELDKCTRSFRKICDFSSKQHLIAGSAIFETHTYFQTEEYSYKNILTIPVVINSIKRKNAVTISNYINWYMSSLDYPEKIKMKTWDIDGVEKWLEKQSYYKHCRFGKDYVENFLTDVGQQAQLIIRAGKKSMRSNVIVDENDETTVAKEVSLWQSLRKFETGNLDRDISHREKLLRKRETIENFMVYKYESETKW